MRHILAVAATMLAATPAWAEDFYILQDKATKQCSVSTTKAMPGGASVQVGSVYLTRAEAEAAMKSMAPCITE